VAEIVLTEDQVRVFQQSSEAVVVRDPLGNALGVLDPKEAAIIAEAKRRLASKEPRIPAARVRAHMEALQAERERRGSLTPEEVTEILARLRAEDEQ
jgi:hypothetical protein